MTQVASTTSLTPGTAPNFDVVDQSTDSLNGHHSGLCNLLLVIRRHLASQDQSAVVKPALDAADGGVTGGAKS